MMKTKLWYVPLNWTNMMKLVMEGVGSNNWNLPLAGENGVHIRQHCFQMGKSLF